MCLARPRYILRELHVRRLWRCDFAAPTFQLLELPHMAFAASASVGSCSQTLTAFAQFACPLREDHSWFFSVGKYLLLFEHLGPSSWCMRLLL